MTDCFELQLLSPDMQHTDPKALSFVGEDASGRFGIQAHHDQFMTVLIPGLARFESMSAGWLYIATTGALVHFSENHLNLISGGVWINADYKLLIEQLENQMRLIREQGYLLKRSMGQMDHQVLRKLWEFEKSNGSV